MPLDDYLMDSMRLLREQRQELINPEDLIAFVNRARREVAMRTQCIRVLTPIAGAVTTASVVAAGSGYTSSPTITISAPDFPSGLPPDPGGATATALAIVSSGTIAAVDISYGGSGYFQPSASITDSAGTGASVSLVVGGVNALVANQERYLFSDVDLSQFPGVESVYWVRGLSVIYSNYRYTCSYYPFQVYQAKIRQYPFQYTYVPAFWSQFGQGTSGSYYVYPLPSQVYQYELDCACLPSNLETNLSEEALPQPWTDSVAFLACHFAMLSIQNYNVAKFYLEQFDMWCQRHSNYAHAGRATNMYGRF